MASSAFTGNGIRRVVLGLALGVGLGGTVWAQSTDTVIRGVIQSQLEAFQADDFATAFSYASPMIQQMFGSPDRFGQMVMGGYPMVWRPAKTEFTALSERAGRMYQSVLITDKQGQLHVLEYEMIPTDDGWEINGVQFLRPGALGA